MCKISYIQLSLNDISYFALINDANSFSKCNLFQLAIAPISLQMTKVFLRNVKYQFFTRLTDVCRFSGICNLTFWIKVIEIRLEYTLCSKYLNK